MNIDWQKTERCARSRAGASAAARGASAERQSLGMPCARDVIGACTRRGRPARTPALLLLRSLPRLRSLRLWLDYAFLALPALLPWDIRLKTSCI